jgi:nucleoside 2-deoxyribosyltransferase
VQECPICGSAAINSKEAINYCAFDCPRCGLWEADGSPSTTTSYLISTVGDWDIVGLRRRSRLSSVLRRQQRVDKPDRWIRLPPMRNWATSGWSDWQLDQLPPAPAEQLDQLIILVGDHQPSVAQSARLGSPVISAWIGVTITRAAPEDGLGWLLRQPENKEYFAIWDGDNATLLFSLTMTGWMRYGTLKRGHVDSRRALMALKFGDPVLDRVVATCFSPAVEQAGFELRTLADAQPAGLIDDQMRVALRTSRFVVADLTHGSSGAYWEAGFAEGLGRPVIYTCRKTEWGENKSHFDTNHLVTVIWDPNELDMAGAMLTATIRATLPTEAKLEE